MPLGIAEFIAASRYATALWKLIDTGGLATLVAEIEVAAAADALRKASEAQDKRSQVWTAIGHLESAFHAELRAAERERMSPKGVLFHFNQMELIEWHKNRAKYVLCLCATAYLSVGESRLALQQLDRFGTVDDIPDLYGWYALTTVVSLSVTAPFGYAIHKVQRKSLERTEVSKEDLALLELNLREIAKSS